MEMKFICKTNLFLMTSKNSFPYIKMYLHINLHFYNYQKHNTIRTTLLHCIYSIKKQNNETSNKIPLMISINDRLYPTASLYHRIN